MVEFTNKVVTTIGSNLIAEAVASNQLIFIKAISSTSYLDSATLQALSDIDTTVFNGPSGTVSSDYTSANSNVARITAEYTPFETDTIVKTVAITGKLANGTEKIIAAYSDNTISVLIPGSGYTQNTFIRFNIIINNPLGSAIIITPGNSVSLSEFNDLLNRTVTTHSIDDATVGEDQVILGNKEFKGNITLNDSSRILQAFGNSSGIGTSETPIDEVWSETVWVSDIYKNSDVSFIGIGDPTTFTSTATFTATATFANITVTGALTAKSITPTSNNTYDLGSVTNKWKALYTNNIDVVNTVTASAIFTSDLNATDLVVADTTTFNGQVTSKSIYVNEGLYIAAVPFYAYGYSSGGIRLTNSNTYDTSYGNLRGNSASNYSSVDAHFITGGTDQYQIRTKYLVDSNNVTTIPSVTSTWSIGDSSYRVKAIYSDNFYGLASKSTADAYSNNIYSSYASALTKNGTFTSGSTNTNTALKLMSKSGATLSTVYLSDIIANALRGYGGTGATSTSAFGSVGSIGLFYNLANENYAQGSGRMVSGSTLYNAYMGWNNSSSAWNISSLTYLNSSASLVGYSSASTLSGTWVLLNLSGYNNHYLTLVLAVRIY